MGGCGRGRDRTMTMTAWSEEARRRSHRGGSSAGVDLRGGGTVGSVISPLHRKGWTPRSLLSRWINRSDG